MTMGLLLGRLPVADALYRTSNAVLPKRPSAPLVSGMILGALLGPMNGSVGTSVLGLSRVVAPRLTAEGIPAAIRDSVIAVASTLGVLIPPSLVLILLGDAMLNAHTLAVTATGRTDRVINTQDIFHAALLPAGIFLLLCFILSWFAGRSATKPPPREKLAREHGLLAGFALVAPDFHSAQRHFWCTSSSTLVGIALFTRRHAVFGIRGAAMPRYFFQF